MHNPCSRATFVALAITVSCISITSCGDGPTDLNVEAHESAEPPSQTGDAYWDWDGIGIATIGPIDEHGCSNYDHFAPPLAWGSWKEIASHIGILSYEVEAWPVGDTQLTGEVRYVGPSGGWIQQQFSGSIAFTTGNAVAAVFVRFTGNPFGTAVNGRICW